MHVTTLPLAIVHCPSDTDHLSLSEDPRALPGWWRNNYRGNAGNDTGELSPAGDENNNGVFVTGRRISTDQITDGTSNTALFCESLLGDGDDNVISNPGDWFVIAPASHSRQDIYRGTASCGAVFRLEITRSPWRAALSPRAITWIRVTTTSCLPTVPAASCPTAAT